MTRELVLDTETTGLDYEAGHRLVEIGILELENHIPTGNYFHYYLNPERDSDIRAEQIHGLTKEFLSDKPKFSDIVDEFLEFISNSKIIIHNASFDVGFINAELKRCNLNELDESSIIDTLFLAKKKFLGQSVSLDSLCKKYSIDLSDRHFHGALKDAKLLASVYLELIGGRQSRLEFDNVNDTSSNIEQKSTISLKEYYKNVKLKTKKKAILNQDDYNMHLKTIKEIKDSIWKKIERSNF